MRTLLVIPILVLLALSGCCGARFCDPNFSNNSCPPGTQMVGAEMLGTTKCAGDGLAHAGGRLRGLWSRATHIPPAAPIPPPNPKYHPVPTRPAFAPQP